MQCRARLDWIERSSGWEGLFPSLLQYISVLQHVGEVVTQSLAIPVKMTIKVSSQRNFVTVGLPVLRTQQSKECMHNEEIYL